MPIGSQELENKAMLLAFDPHYSIPADITPMDMVRIRARADFIIRNYERANTLSAREIRSKAETLASNSSYIIPSQVLRADREIIERMAAAIRAERAQSRSRNGSRGRSGSRNRRSSRGRGSRGRRSSRNRSGSRNRTLIG